MFAALLAGQIVQSNFVEVSPGKLLLDLPPLGKSNHVVVFLTGQTALPVGFGAGVHFGIVENGQTLWSYLGFLSNERPSAIFRVSGLKRTGSVVTARLGISLETQVELSGQTPALENSSTSLGVYDGVKFAQFAAENLFNFASGYAQEVPGTSDAYVPLSVIKRWLDTIQRKLLLDPDFWKK
ncbi:hypothetical protein Aperf_G00000039408 [Anoplocephala perfoliata]